MERYLEKALKKRLGRKILLLAGPRQVGKTVLAKSLNESHAYYNYDIKRDFAVFLEQKFDMQAPLLIFDEIHKMKKWKLWLKGIYDEGRTSKQAIIVTGSARLETMQKVGDSLAGRYFSFRLHPLDLKELAKTDSRENNYKKLLERGGFPEPFLSADPDFHRLWRRTHTDIILRQDLMSLDVVKDIDSLEILVEMLASRVGSTISVKSLSEDLHVSDKTVNRWLRLLEDLYIVFRVTPFSKNIPRSLRKASKFYFFDLGRINGNESVKLENLVALSIKKELDFLEDTKGFKTKLHFLRTKDLKEIDFFVQIEKNNPFLIEVKLSDGAVSDNFKFFSKIFPNAHNIQWVKNIERPYTTKNNIRVEAALPALERLTFI